MKKRPNKNRKLVQSTDFFYYYIFIFPMIFVLYFYVYILQPISTNPPFFMEFGKRNLIYNNSYMNSYEKLLKSAQKLHDKGIINSVVFHGSRDKKMIALTFDADMTIGMAQMLTNKTVDSFYDSRLIEELRSSKTPATLFITGMWTEMYPSETQDLADDPLFELGSHSYAHMGFSGPCYSLPEMNSEDKIQDIGTSQFLLQKYTGKKIKLFRFPGGCYSLDDVLLVKKAGMTPVQWDVVAHDGFNSSTESILANILNNVKNGSIIVMHMNGFPNEPVDDIVVPQVIKILSDRGFQFVTVSQLLDNPEAYAND